MQKRIYYRAYHFLICFSPFLRNFFQYDIIVLPGPHLPRLSRLPTNADFSLRRQENQLSNLLVHKSILSSISVALSAVSGTKQDPHGVLWVFRGPSCHDVAWVRTGSSPQPQAPDQILPYSLTIVGRNEHFSQPSLKAVVQSLFSCGRVWKFQQPSISAACRAPPRPDC